jgi:hypothetical protein
MTLAARTHEANRRERFALAVIRILIPKTRPCCAVDSDKASAAIGTWLGSFLVSYKPYWIQARGDTKLLCIRRFIKRRRAEELKVCNPERAAEFLNQPGIMDLILCPMIPLFEPRNDY